MRELVFKFNATHEQLLLYLLVIKNRNKNTSEVCKAISKEIGGLNQYYQKSCILQKTIFDYLSIPYLIQDSILRKKKLFILSF
jgi:hypothetical protein